MVQAICNNDKLQNFWKIWSRAAVLTGTSVQLSFVNVRWGGYWSWPLWEQILQHDRVKETRMCTWGENGSDMLYVLVCLVVPPWQPVGYLRMRSLKNIFFCFFSAHVYKNKLKKRLDTSEPYWCSPNSINYRIKCKHTYINMVKLNTKVYLHLIHTHGHMEYIKTWPRQHDTHESR